jgi:broad specificity phosphatase PhoE
MTGAGRNPPTVISSPLSRARETMEIIRTGLGLAPQPYVIDARLAEMSFGSWEGLTYEEIRARDRAGPAMRERDNGISLRPTARATRSFARE